MAHGEDSISVSNLRNLLARKKDMRGLSLYEHAALGNIAGMTTQLKFFQNDDIDAGLIEDIWEYGGKLVYLTSGSAIYASSSSAQATQIITIRGADATGAFQQKSVTLTGQTPVLVDGTWTRVWRVFNSGSSESPASSTVYISRSSNVTNGVPTLASDVLATFIAAHEQTMMCHFFIPTGYVALLKSLRLHHGASSGTVTAKHHLKQRNEGGVWRTIYELDTNAGIHRVKFDLPIIYQEHSDILLESESSGQNLNMSGSYSMLLIPSAIYTANATFL